MVYGLLGRAGWDIRVDRVHLFLFFVFVLVAITVFGLNIFHSNKSDLLKTF